LPAPKGSLSGKGCKPWMDVKGGIALQFLKHYLCLSDELLIQRINTDWSMQYFCGIQLKPNEVIRDTNLPSWWRGYIGKHLDIAAMQKQFALYWKEEINQTNISTEGDATCYESRISFPTPVKLLWACCNEVYVSYNRADKIYATNGNRTYCTSNKITTNFLPKGKQKLQHIEQSKVMRAVLNKERGTRLEGSFGNEKNHYLLQKVNARNADTEKCWIFFGMMTANASIITERKQRAIRKAA